MVGWIILGVLILLIVGINSIRVGADISYEDGVFGLSAKVAGMMLQLLPKQEKGEPKPKKEKKPKKKKKEKPKKEKPKEESASGKKGLPLGMNVDELLELVKNVLRLLGRFPRKFRIDRFKLHLCAAGADPYSTAMTYAYLNESLSILHPLACKAFTVKKSDIWTDVDFTADKMFVEFGLGLSIRIGQIVGLGLAIAFAGAKTVIKSKLRQKKEKKAVPPELTETAEHKETTETDKDIQPEERMETNG